MLGFLLTLSWLVEISNVCSISSQEPFHNHMAGMPFHILLLEGSIFYFYFDLDMCQHLFFWLHQPCLIRNLRNVNEAFCHSHLVSGLTDAGPQFLFLSFTQLPLISCISHSADASNKYFGFKTNTTITFTARQLVSYLLICILVHISSAVIQD